MNIYGESGGHSDPPVFGATKRNGSSYPHAKRIFGNLQQQISSASSSGAKKSKSRWAAPDPILPVKPWQVGEQCQALYAGDNQFHAAIIEEITTDGEVSIRFKGYKGNCIE